MASPITPARIAFDRDGARSLDYDDVYHSVDGGLAQARHVFLAGNGLPARWQRRERFTVLETGFGLGNSFLATWAALAADPLAPARLHFVSVEAHPAARADLARASQALPELAAFARPLIEAWPPAVPGFHRLHFGSERVTLTLLFGDARDMLGSLDLAADALYLDGFAPDRNPAMWSDGVVRELARLCAPDATAATWTVAGAVRARLAEHGFVVEKRPGFGRKREMLAARRTGPPAARGARPRHAIVVGAGLAGSAAAERLAARGWHIDLIDRHARPAQEGSGNRCGVLRPVLNLPDNGNARLGRAAYLYAIEHLRALPIGPEGAGAPGVLHVAVTADEAARMARVHDRHAHPADYAAWVDAGEAARLAGHPVAGPGWWFPRGAWAMPAAVCGAQIARHGRTITCHMGRVVARLARAGEDWTAVDPHGRTIARAPAVIVAAAAEARTLAPALAVPLAQVRGQITLLPALPQRRLTAIVCGDGYVAPLPEGGFCVGATFDPRAAHDREQVADHAENLARVERLLPGFAPPIDPASLTGRAGLRTATPDRLPACGAIGPRMPDVYALTGLGARGLIWAPLCAELLAAELEGEPPPLPRDLIAAMDPRRAPRPRRRESD